MHRILFSLIMLLPMIAHAQIGDHRNEIAVGVNGGYTMSSVGFSPNVPQKALGGATAGLTVRYTCEKYFKSICALVAEVNVTQMGWNEDIKDADNNPVINSVTDMPEEYQRQITYIQVPLMARLGWGRERKGVQAFFQLGPQFGYFLKEKTTTNFDYDYRNITDRVGVQQYDYQYNMAVENKFDYGIAVGLGLEFSLPKLGHLLLEGRYYYGLGNIYGNSKSDVFGKSNNNSIMIKMTYLFDIIKTNNPKIR
ncbi:MAG: porin family protein [Prevotella sp.]